MRAIDHEQIISQAKDLLLRATLSGLQVSGPNTQVAAFYSAPALLEQAVHALEELAARNLELLAALEVMRARLDYSDPHGDAPMICAAIAKAKGGDA